jgi:hypothetical protein
MYNKKHVLGIFRPWPLFGVLFCDPRVSNMHDPFPRATGNLRPDFLALQEVDPPLQIASCLAECGYQGHETVTDPSGRIGRVDACALYYRQDTWKSVDVVSLRLDDLASLCSRNQGGSFHSSTRASLEGIECSFLRRNMALLVRLQHLSTGHEIVIATAHLFWNPFYPEVKVTCKNMNQLTEQHITDLKYTWHSSATTVHSSVKHITSRPKHTLLLEVPLYWW